MSSGGQYGSYDVEYTSSLDVSGKVVTVALVVIVTFVVFILCFQIFARCLDRGPMGEPRALGGSPGGDRDPATLQPVALEKSVIESLPVFVYQSAEHKDRLECAVCLSEFEDNEKARLLPNCNHSFHVDCIDMWFHSHSTCPLCRSTARPHASSTVVVVGEPSRSNPATDEEAPGSVAVDGSPSEQQRGGEAASATGENDGPCASCRLDDGLPSPTRITNVLFWGSRNQISSRFNPSSLDQGTSSPKALGKIAIDIPRRADGFPSPRLFTGDVQQGFSPGGPSSKSPSARLRSLKRLLSRDRALPQSPHGLDLEQAGQSQAEV